MADHGAGGAQSADTGPHDQGPTNHDAQFLPLQTDEQSHNDTRHHNGADHNDKQHHHGHGDDLEAGYGGYGSINRGSAPPHETTAAELWERQQQNRACFNSDVFFALVVTFALGAVALTWLTLSPIW